MTTTVTARAKERTRKRLALNEARTEMLQSGAILPTLLRLAMPNLVALCSATVISIAETAYVGALGVASLGGVALAFPIFMLMQMLSAGAMGGTVSGAVSRALGAGDCDRAQALALCAVVIAFGLGLLFTAAVLIIGPAVYRTLGGSGGVLSEALAFSNVAAWAIGGSGSPISWHRSLVDQATWLFLRELY